MIIDSRVEFCDATSAAINIGNAIIGNVVDTGAAPTLKNLGVTPVYLVITVDTAFAGTNGTVQLQLCSDSTEDLATSKTIHIDTGAIPVATLVAGYTICRPLPSQGTFERYIGLWETVATTNISAGKINAFLTEDPGPYNVALPDAV
jgi:hypothetical protein